jgi:hypothetical protein
MNRSTSDMTPDNLRAPTSASRIVDNRSVHLTSSTSDAPIRVSTNPTDLFKFSLNSGDPAAWRLKPEPYPKPDTCRAEPSGYPGDPAKVAPPHPSWPSANTSGLQVANSGRCRDVTARCPNEAKQQLLMELEVRCGNCRNCLITPPIGCVF